MVFERNTFVFNTLFLKLIANIFKILVTMTNSHDLLLLAYLSVCMFLMNLPSSKVEKTEA
jgi:hypothetical protein